MKKIKINTIELKQFIGRPIQEVYDYVKKEYPDQLPFSGVDFYENECLKDGNYHFFFGSLFRLSRCYWNVPYVHWDGSSFFANGNWLGNDWHSNYRVVRLETLPVALDSNSPVTLVLLHSRRLMQKLLNYLRRNRYGRFTKMS